MDTKDWITDIDELVMGDKKREELLNYLLQNWLSCRIFIEMEETGEERNEEFNFGLIKFKMPIKHSNVNAKTRSLDLEFKFSFISTYVVMKTVWLDKMI